MPNIQIIASDESVGSLKFTICNNREELEKCHNFERSRPSLEQCLRYVAMEEEYPMAFLTQITVEKNYRRNPNRYGSSLIGKFEEISTDHWCKMAACKVAWPESTREESILFYEKCDWKLYDLPGEPVMAFKVFDANAPKKTLKQQTTSKMIVFWKDENFHDSLAPKRVG